MGWPCSGGVSLRNLLIDGCNAFAARRNRASRDRNRVRRSRHALLQTGTRLPKTSNASGARRSEFVAGSNSRLRGRNAQAGDRGRPVKTGNRVGFGRNV